MPERTPYLAANWKMHKTVAEAAAFVDGLVHLPVGGEVGGALRHRSGPPRRAVSFPPAAPTRLLLRSTPSPLSQQARSGAARRPSRRRRPRSCPAPPPPPRRPRP